MLIPQVKSKCRRHGSKTIQAGNLPLKHSIIAAVLFLQSITVYQFRNYLHRSFTFHERITGICGLNGTGKTNLLDAIYYLSFTKSYFSRSDSSNVHHQLQGLRLDGCYQLLQQEQKVACILRENNRKELSLNGEEYKKFSEHIGKLPCVMIAPDDVELITGSSEERRKFIDTILSQIHKPYLQQLIEYTKLLQQRNSLLKQAADSGYLDEALLDIYSEQLCSKGQFIYEQRRQFLQSFLPMAADYYQKIAGTTDTLSLAYESQLHQAPMQTLLQTGLHKDKVLQRTNYGIHKDDIAIQMGNNPFKTEASQGQRKSLLFALKLAEWQTLKDNKGFAPILLLDDVFEKLDEQRMHNLLHWVCKEDDGQVFITDTHKERLQQQLQAVGVGFQLVELDKNNL